MNFEEIKENWNNDKSDDSSNLESIELTQKGYQSPIKRIKYRMIQEFIGTWISLIGLTIAFFKLPIFSNFSIQYLVGNIILISIPTLYYHCKFYGFYKDFLVQSISTYSNLRRFSLKMSDFVSKYREYNYFVFLIAGNFIYRISDKLGSVKIIMGDHRDKDLESLFFLAFMFIIVIIATEVVSYFFYRRPLNEVNMILKELDDELEAE